MNEEDIKYFNTKEGISLLEKYKGLLDEDLEMQAFNLAKNNAPHYQYLITLLKLRRKAKFKFSMADKMFFSTAGLEMATSEKIATHIAERFIGRKKIVDLTCGIGGNAVFLAKVGKVEAIDFNRQNILMARYNAEVYGVEKNTKFIIGDAFLNISCDADAFFVDPMRTRDGKTKTRSIFNTEPKLDKMLKEIFKVSKNVCVKISPAFDYKEISKLEEIPEIELVSEDNENKVALLWFGDFKKNHKKATLFVGDEKIEIVNEENSTEIPVIKKFEKYVFEPNVAIIKAYLIDEEAKKAQLSKINKNIAFLTKNSRDLIDKRKFRIYKVLKYGPFSVKNLRSDLREYAPKYISVVNRGTPIMAEKLIRDLKLKEGRGLIVLLTKLKDEKNYYAITEKIKII